MRTNRFYHSGELEINQQLELDKDVSGHIFRVLRLQAKAQIELFNGDGNNYQAVISESGKKVKVTITAKEVATNESPLKVHLLQAISRGERMDYTLQKAVELGIHEITPLISERVQFRMDEKRLQKKYLHWSKVIISAAEQSGRAYIPKLNPAVKIDEYLTQNTTAGIVLDPCSTQKLQTLETPTEMNLLVGPEGGLSDSEIELATKHHFTAIYLGPRILRTETAALCALSILQSTLGDL